jgi:prepilin-type N-terminal cleavage/methylation domain-containing protein
MTNQRILERLRSDTGFGLIEIVISMFLLAILAMLFLPLLIQGLKQSADNTTLATGTQLVNDKLRAAQAASPVCADVSALTGTSDYTDPRGVVIRLVTTVGTCPTGDGTVSFSVTATRTDTSVILATASTLVLVS